MLRSLNTVRSVAAEPVLLVTQGAADATDFEGVGEAGVDMVVAVDWMDLCFAPQQLLVSERMTQVEA